MNKRRDRDLVNKQKYCNYRRKIIKLKDCYECWHEDKSDPRGKSGYRDCGQINLISLESFKSSPK